MNNVRILPVYLALLLGTNAFAIPKPPPPYESTVKSIRSKQTKLPQNPLYIAGAVKKPGAYQFKGRTRVFEVVNFVGGFDFAGTTAPVRGWIAVYRPTQTEPNPYSPSFTCDLDVKDLPDMGVKNCAKYVGPGDLILVKLWKEFHYILP